MLALLVILLLTAVGWMLKFNDSHPTRCKEGFAMGSKTRFYYGFFMNLSKPAPHNGWIDSFLNIGGFRFPLDSLERCWWVRPFFLWQVLKKSWHCWEARFFLVMGL